MIVTLVLPEGTRCVTHVAETGLRLAWNAKVRPEHVTRNEKPALFSELSEYHGMLVAVVKLMVTCPVASTGFRPTGWESGARSPRAEDLACP